jgi:ATP dependent DNA ligase-like protein
VNFAKVFFDDSRHCVTIRDFALLWACLPKFPRGFPHKGIWVEPELLAEIEYRAKSAEGKVRHPFFKGLRDCAIAAIQSAHRVLGEYVAPGPRDAVATVDRLLDILANRDIEAADAT